MAGIKKECGLEKFLKEGFSFADLKKEMDARSTKVKQVNSASKMGDQMDMSLIRIKTEPGLITDCDIATAPTNFMHHQEVNSFETITAIKEEINSDTDSVNNNNVTVHLLIPEIILAEKMGDVQANSEEILPSSVDSDMPSMQSTLTKTREDCLQSNVRSDAIPETTPRQSISGSTNKLPGKEKYSTNFVILESFTPQSSTTGVSEIVAEPPEPVKKSTKRKTGLVSDKMPNEVPIIDLENPMPETSTRGCNETNISQQPKKRGRKKLSQRAVRKPRKKEIVICPFCDRPVVKTYFNFHMRVHTDEKPFKCPNCPYKSHFKGPLDFHMESHHPTEGYIKPKQ